MSAFETTLKKMYQQLMKDIKKYPEDVIYTLKEKKKKDVTSKISLNTAVPLGTGDDEKESARLDNEAYKLDFVNQKCDARIRDQTLDSNLRVAYTIIFLISVTRNYRIAWRIRKISQQRLRMIQ